jgi:hypothetical protein
MSHSLTVSVKGIDKDIAALEQMLEQAVKGKSSNNAINEFFGEIGITKNPLKRGETEFSLSAEEDSENLVEIDDPYPFYTGLSEAFPQIGFFCYSAVNTDDGNGVEYKIFKNGTLAEEKNNFYYGSDCGGYPCTHIPADACYKWVKAKYSLWRIEDLNDIDAISEAKKAEEKARQDWDAIHDFLLDGGIDHLDTDTGILKVRNGDELDILSLLEEEGGYNGFSITQIETIDFSDEDWCEEWKELPDLSGFTGLKTLNLSGCVNISGLPDKLVKNFSDEKLDIIGFSLRYIADSLKTEELCFAAVKKSGWELEFVPENLKTEELCFEAVKQSWRALQYTEAHLSIRILRAAFAQNGKLLQNMVVDPDEAKGLYVCAPAVAQNPEALQFVPEGLRKFFPDGKVDWIALADIDVELLDYMYLSHLNSEQYLEIVKKHPDALEYVPEELKTTEFCLTFVRGNPEGFLSIPVKYRSREICLIAIKSYGSFCELIPEEIQSEEFFIEAVKVNTNGKALKYTPEEFRTKEVCLAAVQQAGNALEYVPKKLRTPELCITAVKQNADALEFVPEAIREQVKKDAGIV